jgi:cytochrome P450
MHSFGYNLVRVIEATLILFATYGISALGWHLAWKYLLPAQRPSKMRWDMKEKAWIVRRYDDIATLIRHPRVVANMFPSIMNRLDEADRSKFVFLQSFFLQWPLFQDGTKQRLLHSVLAGFFSSKKVEALSDTVSEVLEQLLGAIEKKQTWDVVSDLAQPLPLRVIMKVIGFPREDEEKFHQWADIVKEWFGGMPPLLPRFQKCQLALKEFSTYAEKLVRSWEEQLAETKKRGSTSPNISSEECVGYQMVEAVQSGKLQREELIPNLFFLMAAAHETTTCLIGHAIFTLLEEPFQLDYLRVQWTAAESSTSRDQLTGQCVEEVLRYCSPISRMSRQVAHTSKAGRARAGAVGAVGAADSAVEFQGHILGEGQTIHFLNPCANMDPAVFKSPEPEKFDIRRRNSRRHMGLGYGDHVCPGMRLGKLQCRLVVQEVLLKGRFPTLRLAVDACEVKTKPLDSINALVLVPVTHAALGTGSSDSSSPSDDSNKKTD